MAKALRVLGGGGGTYASGEFVPEESAFAAAASFAIKIDDEVAVQSTIPLLSSSLMDEIYGEIQSAIDEQGFRIIALFVSPQSYVYSDGQSITDAHVWAWALVKSSEGYQFVEYDGR